MCFTGMIPVLEDTASKSRAPRALGLAPVVVFHFNGGRGIKCKAEMLG